MHGLSDQVPRWYNKVPEHETCNDLIFTQPFLNTLEIELFFQSLEDYAYHKDTLTFLKEKYHTLTMSPSVNSCHANMQ